MSSTIISPRYCIFVVCILLAILMSFYYAGFVKINAVVPNDLLGAEETGVDAKGGVAKINVDSEGGNKEKTEAMGQARADNDTVRSNTTEVHKDVVDNAKGAAYLQKYDGLFNKGKNSSVGDPDLPASITLWWQAAAMINWYIEAPVRYHCKKHQPAGNWHVCQDSPYTVKPPCLVYSFGINWDFSFDYAMGKLGCEVHSFDPSMKIKDHNRNAQVRFHNMGLSSNDSDTFNPRRDIYVHKNQFWKMRTLKTAMKDLGHAGRVLDVLKIDIEGHEWDVIENMMDTGMFQYVRQFELEFHLFPIWPAKGQYVHLYNIYRKLREMGFREYSISPHPKNLTVKHFNLQGDSEYVNIFF